VPSFKHPDSYFLINILLFLLGYFSITPFSG